MAVLGLNDNPLFLLAYNPRRVASLVWTAKEADGRNKNVAPSQNAATNSATEADRTDLGLGSSGGQTGEEGGATPASGLCKSRTPRARVLAVTNLVWCRSGRSGHQCFC